MTTKGTGTYAGFIRVSRLGERKAGDDDVHTDRDQVSDIERGVPKGSRLHMLAPEFNVSGGLPLEKRPSLLAAIEGVERGEYAGIIVAYLSRLGRNVREQLRAWDRVEAAGGRIIVVQEGIDTSTRAGRLQRNLLLSIAEDERERHVEHFGNLKRWAVERGIWSKRQTPRGYRRDEATRRLVADEHAQQVHGAFVEFGEMGCSVRALGRELGMTTSGVRQLLANRVYLGELRDGEYVNPRAHEAIVEPELFDAVQIRLAAGARPTRSGKPTALLAGLARCTGCGHVLSRSAHVYVCHRQYSGGVCPAPVAVTAARIDEHVEAIARAELANLRVEGESGFSLERAREELQRAEAELAAYLAAVSAADVGAVAFGEGARVRREAVDEARAAFVAEQQIAPSFIHATGAGAWDDLGADERNQVLRGLLHCVLVAPAGRGYRGPVEARVRVIGHGADLELPGPGELIAIPLPDRDSPAVLRMPLGEDTAQRVGGAEQVAA